LVVRIFRTLTFTVLGNANADAEIGAVVEGQLNLAKRSFALPPGKWTVVSSDEYTASAGVNRTGRIKQQYLVQTDAENRFVAGANVRTTTNSANVSSWNDSNCDRTDTLVRDTFNSGFSFPSCLFVNHLANFGVGVPSNEYDKKIWVWLRDAKVVLPKTAISTLYIKYFSGDFVSVRYSLNPEVGGVAPDTSSVWNQSQWHPEVIKESSERLKYMDALKVWNAALVASSNESLKDGKPQLVSLPVLPGLTR
jgi:hypothetical protein